MTKITRLEKREGEYIAEFDNSCFRPSGGGQPSDRGVVKGSQFNGEVIEVTRENDKILHRIRAVQGTLSIDDELELFPDLKRKAILTRMHTGEHILFRSLQNFVPTLRLNKINLDEMESLLMVFAERLSWAEIFKAEGLANQIIEENRQVRKLVYSKDDVEKLKEVRIKLERIKDSSVNVIEIENFDSSACTGSHCSSTKEVGGVFVTRLNSCGQGVYELRFKVEFGKEIMEMSRICREVGGILGTEKIIETVKNLKESNELLKKQLRELAKGASGDVSCEEVNDTKFYYKKFEEFEKDVLTRQMNELSKEKAVVVFINIVGGVAQLMISVSRDSPFDASVLLKGINSKYRGKGGGKKNFAMGAFDINHVDRIFDDIKTML